MFWIVGPALPSNFVLPQPCGVPFDMHTTASIRGKHPFSLYVHRREFTSSTIGGAAGNAIATPRSGLVSNDSAGAKLSRSADSGKNGQKKNFNMDTKMKCISLAYFRFHRIEDAADKSIDTNSQNKFIDTLDSFTRIAIPIIKSVVVFAGRACWQGEGVYRAVRCNVEYWGQTLHSHQQKCAVGWHTVDMID